MLSRPGLLIYNWWERNLVRPLRRTRCSPVKPTGVYARTQQSLSLGINSRETLAHRHQETWTKIVITATIRKSLHHGSSHDPVAPSPGDCSLGKPWWRPGPGRAPRRGPQTPCPKLLKAHTGNQIQPRGFVGTLGLELSIPPTYVCQLFPQLATLGKG